MFIEALMKPLRVTLPRDGGDVMLHPGTPVDLPAQIAWKLLRQAKGRVRLALSLTADWLSLWRFVAEVSNGLEPDDPRLSPVMAAIHGCDAAFVQGDKKAFMASVEAVMKAMEGNGHENLGLF